MIKIILIILTILFVFWAFVIEPNLLNIKHYKINDKELSGLKIVFAADFHIGKKDTKRLSRIVNLINEQHPDLVLLGGDFVKGHREKTTLPIELIAYEISHIKSPNGIYTVLGNHDGWLDAAKSKKNLEQNGIKVLENENAKVIVNGKTIYIAGVEDLQTGEPNLHKSFENSEKPRILLSHNPDIFPHVNDGDTNIILSGHIHGGQVALPFIGPLIIPSDYGKKFVYGLIEENNKRMVVTKGLGTSILPLRFCCIPEIVVIEFI